MVTGWLVSVIVYPPRFVTEFIWQRSDSMEEKRLLNEKLGLDASQIKKVFYNTKTTILVDRFLSNIIETIDPTKYFFMERQVKFPFAMIFGFSTGIYILIKKNKYLQFWIAGLALAILVSLLKNTTGWNIVVFPFYSLVTAIGLSHINKQKYGWSVILLITLFSSIEIIQLIV